MNVWQTTIKGIVCGLTMSLVLAFSAHAEENWDLDDVTIEVVEEGEEIANQIPLPPLGQPNTTPEKENIRSQNTEDKAGDAVPQSGGDATAGAKTEAVVESRPYEGGKGTSLIEHDIGSSADDEFLGVIGEAEDLENLLQDDEQEAVEMADELLQQASEEMQEIEEEVETTSQDLEEDQRDESALVEEIKQYEPETEEEEEKEPEVIDQERDEEQGVGGASSEATLE